MCDGVEGRGFTLVELLVALVVLEVGLLGVVGTLVLASGTLAGAEALERLVDEAGAVRDSLAAVAEPGPGSRETPWGALRWDGVEDGAVELELTPTKGTTHVVMLPAGGGGGP